MIFVFFSLSHSLMAWVLLRLPLRDLVHVHVARFGTSNEPRIIRVLLLTATSVGYLKLDTTLRKLLTLAQLAALVVSLALL